MISTTTIVAVSSPPGRSRRGLIRLSGPDAARIAEVLTGQALPLPRTLAVRRLHLLMSSHAAGRSGSPATCGDALAILLTWFRGPASYTGQDVVELQLPGNAALLERVLRAAFDAGAQPAEPGEFTFRAFLAGKLDLTEAEGIAATIAATSDGQLRAATMLRRGELGTWATGLVEHLATQLALTEAGIDFADQEDVIPISPADLARELAVIEDRLSQLLARARSWSELETLPWVVLVGAPSAGKSTLFNALLGRQRAVVHDLPGTTRDVIREPLALPRGEVMLVDIAGLDDPRNRLDEQVQSLARDAIARADLIVNVLDPTRGDVPTHDGLTVYTKADLPDAGSPPPPGKRSLPPGSERMNTADSKPPSCGDRETLHVSAVTGVGLDALRRAIGEHLAGQAVSVSGEALALRPRHEAAMRRARQQLGEAQRLLKPQVTARAIEHVELVAGCLRAALDELAGLGGRMSPDDVIGRVFATFCVGK